MPGNTPREPEHSPDLEAIFANPGQGFFITPQGPAMHTFAAFCHECGYSARSFNVHSDVNMNDIECPSCHHIGIELTTRRLTVPVHCVRCDIDEFETEIVEYTVPETREVILVCRDCRAIMRQEEVIHVHSWIPSQYRLVHSDNESADHRTIYYGTELEINTDTPDIVRHAKDFKAWLKANGIANLFFFKRDGSISQGYEIVTHPLTAKARNENINWRDICQYLKANGASSYESGECGLHIHASVGPLTRAEIGKLKYFFFANRLKLHAFSGRQNYRYCQIERFGIRDAKWVRPIRALNSYPDSGDRYVAVNTHTGKPTIEFRIFRGTLDHTRLIASFQIVDALIHYVKSHSILSSDTPYSWATFRRWARETNRYNHLTNYLEKEDIK